MICPDEKALIEACLDPDNAEQEAPPRVYADFLRERGREAQADLVERLVELGDLTVRNRHQVVYMDRSLFRNHGFDDVLGRVDEWGRVPCPECDGTVDPITPTDRLCARCRSTGDIGGLTWFRNTDTVLDLQASPVGCCARHADNMSCRCLEEAVQLEFRRGILVGIHNLPTWRNLFTTSPVEPDGTPVRWTGTTEWLDRLRVHHPFVRRLVPRVAIHMVEYGAGDDRWRIFDSAVPEPVGKLMGFVPRLPEVATEYPSHEAAVLHLTDAMWKLVQILSPEPRNV